METFTPSQILNSLGLKSTNHGTSTGKSWMENTETIGSFSPIDNLQLGHVSITTKEQYETVVSSAQSAYKELRTIQLQNEGNSYVSSVMH